MGRKKGRKNRPKYITRSEAIIKEAKKIAKKYDERWKLGW